MSPRLSIEPLGAFHRSTKLMAKDMKRLHDRLAECQLNFAYGETSGKPNCRGSTLDRFNRILLAIIGTGAGPSPTLRIQRQQPPQGAAPRRPTKSGTGLNCLGHEGQSTYVVFARAHVRDPAPVLKLAMRRHCRPMLELMTGWLAVWCSTSFRKLRLRSLKWHE